MTGRRWRCRGDEPQHRRMARSATCHDDLVGEISWSPTECRGGSTSNGATAVTLGPAAHERLLVTQRMLRAASRSPTLPAVQHRINPMRRLLAASHGVAAL